MNELKAASVSKQSAPAASGVLRRKCSGCKKKEKEKVRLQRTAVRSSPVMDVPPIVHEVLRSPGQPLAAETRAFMEPRFGHDFSRVRVHTDAKAAESARAVNALAYTSGNHVVFGAAQYRPGTIEGSSLVAHELTHVLQQRVSGIASKLSLNSPNSALEAQADQVAQRVLSDTSLPRMYDSLHSGVPALQRQVGPFEEAEATMEQVSMEEDDEAMDGDSPPGSISPVGQLSLAQMAEESGEESEFQLAVASPANIQTVSLTMDTGQGVIQRRQVRSPLIPAPVVGQRRRWIRRINIDLTSQQLTIIWSDGSTDGPELISSGRGCPNTRGNPCVAPNRNDSYCTPTGNFHVMGLGGRDHRNSHGDLMRWFVLFDNRGIGIHGGQRVPRPPRPLSHGCVRVHDAVARLINRNVTSATVIRVQGTAPTRQWSGDARTLRTYTGCPARPPRPPGRSRRGRR